MKASDSDKEFYRDVEPHLRDVSKGMKPCKYVIADVEGLTTLPPFLSTLSTQFGMLNSSQPYRPPLLVAG
jgi:hypothetical protein